MSQAGERTEQATPRRIEKAREDGKIVSSRHLVVAVQFIVAFFYLRGADDEVLVGLHQWKVWLASAFDHSGFGWNALAPSIGWTKQTLSFFLWSGAITCGSVLA